GDDRSLGRRLEQHVAAAQTYQQFRRLCQEADPKQCALAGLGDPEEVVENHFDQLSENPIEVPGPDGSTTEFGYDDAVLMIFQAMYSPTQWQDLATALAQMVQPEQSDPSEQSDQSDQSEQSKKSNRSLARPSEQDSIRDFLRKIGFFSEYHSAGGPLASMYMDTHSPGTLPDHPAQADAAEDEAEHFRAALACVGSQCETIGVQDEDAYTGPWQQTTEAPVLVIGTRYDPATGYKFTEPYADL